MKRNEYRWSGGNPRKPRPGQGRSRRKPRSSHHTPANTEFFEVPIIQSIQFGIARNTGILKVVGDVGTGKTMLCRLLLRKLVSSNDAVAYLNAPQCDPESLVGLVCTEFGLESGTRTQMMQSLNTFLLEQHAIGRNAVLIVDEAQALGAEWAGNNSPVIQS